MFEDIRAQVDKYKKCLFISKPLADIERKNLEDNCYGYITDLLAKVDELTAENTQLRAGIAGLMSSKLIDTSKHDIHCAADVPSCQCLICAKDSKNCCTGHHKHCKVNDCPDYTPEATT